MDRRAFLQATVAAAACSRCGTTGLSGHRVPDRPCAPERSTVAVVRAAGFTSHEAAVREAVRLAGGLGFIGNGDRVLLKPAVNSSNRYPATTDPETVSIVGKLVKERGGVPFIADRTMFLKATPLMFSKTGMTEAAHALGAELLALEYSPTVLAVHTLADHWFGNAVPVYRPVLAADHIINLCTPRTHSVGDVTMALKNHVGVVDGLARAAMHGPGAFKERVAEISLVTRDDFIVMDGREGFSNGGPDDGDLVHPGFVAAGKDPVAVDAVAIAYLRKAGTNDAVGLGSLWRIPTIQRAAQMGLGVPNADRIDLVGLTPADLADLQRVMV